MPEEAFDSWLTASADHSRPEAMVALYLAHDVRAHRCSLSDFLVVTFDTVAFLVAWFSGFKVMSKKLWLTIWMISLLITGAIFVAIDSLMRLQYVWVSSWTAQGQRLVLFVAPCLLISSALVAALVGFRRWRLREKSALPPPS